MTLCLWERWGRPFASNRRGSMAVEFGLIAGPFFALMVTLIQTGYDCYAARAVDVVLQKAARFVMIGAATQLDAEALRDKACAGAVAINCKKLQIDVQAVQSFGASENLVTSDIAAAKAKLNYNLAPPGQYCLLQAFYPAPVFGLFSNARVTTEADGSRVRYFRSTAVVRVE